MSGTPDRTYAQGDPWRPNAAQFNFWTAGGRRAQQGDLPATAPRTGPQFYTPVAVINDTETALPHLACIAFRDPQFTAAQNENLFREGVPLKCRLPIDDSSYRHGILTEALTPGQSGLAVLSGVTACRVTGASGNYAAPVPDDHVLAVGASGWPLLWKEAGTTERWGLVEVGGVSAQGAPRIRFQILSCSFSIGLGAQGCDHVTAIVTHVSCGGAGVNVGDEVDIYDPEYCHFNLPVELLVGLSGSATKMDAASYQNGMEYLVDCVPDVQALGCIWMIDHLCCAEEETLYVEA